jgi:hypothetical protein
MGEYKAPRKSALKSMPEVRQEGLHEYSKEHTLAECVVWLAQDGVRVSIQQVSTFLQWFRLRKQVTAYSDQTTALNSFLRTKLPTMPPEQLEAYADAMFKIQSVATNHPDVYVELKKLEQAEKRIELERRKVELAEKEAKLAAEARVVESSPLSDEEKYARLKEIFKR